MNSLARRSPVNSANSNCFNVVTSLNTNITNNYSVSDSYKNSWNTVNIVNTSVSDKKRQILEWLSPLESRVRHEDVRDTRADGVGDWLLRTEMFSAWHTLEDHAAKPILLCYGGPGVGKTFTSSLVIDTLCDKICGRREVVTCVYCDFSDENVQSPSTVLGSVLRQVIAALAHIPDTVEQAFDRAKWRVGGLGLLLPEILEVLIGCLSSLKRAYVCIDSLDEFPLRYRPELWRSLQRVVRECPNTRLFLTGRPHIRDEVRKYFPRAAKMLHLSPSEHDIGLYLRMRLSRDMEPEAMDKELEADILTIIPERISGIFLLVSLSMDAILVEVTIDQRRRALRKITNGFGLQDVYNTTMDRIRQQGGSNTALGMGALMWVSWCERPLKSEELRHALGVRLGAGDFNVDNAPSIQTILGCTLGLVTIDEEDSTAHLLHFTLQEYLRQHPTAFVTAHSVMAEICLTYLNSRSVRALPPNPDTVLARQPFLEYATRFWGTHAASGMTDPVKSLALQFLDGYENHVSTAFLWPHKILERDSAERIQGISRLHYIAFLGITEIAIPMLEMKKWDVNGRDSRGDTPLMWAIKYGKDRIVNLFLDQEDIEPDVVIRDGRTVFSFAAGWGSEDVVKLLLRHTDVNPNSSDNNGRTPLSHAASGGHEAVVKLLLECGDVNPNLSDNHGRTPLSHATSGGDGGVVKLLLGRGDVNLNLSDNHGRTPLSPVPSGGDADAVRQPLAGGDANSPSPDCNGRTPMLYTAQPNYPRVGFPFFLLTSMLFALTLSVLLSYYRNGDPRGPIHAIHGARR